MSDGMLSERDVLNLMGWPSREFVNARIRTSKFPRPAVRYRGIGDQWRESDIKRWRDGNDAAAKSGEALLLERFS
jgi:hypothetical protein